jgi:CRP/FNR family transcriptional regulator, nitrogen fixation regulation protein
MLSLVCSWISRLAEIRSGGQRLISRTILHAAKLQTIELCYGPGESVYERGAPAQFVYAVDTGVLCRLRLLTGDRRSILQFLFPDDGFGYETGRQHRDTVQALTHTKVLAAGREALLAAATSDRRLWNLLFTAATKTAADAEDQAVFRIRTATERIAQFLLEMDFHLSTRGRIDLPMSRRDIADYIGVTLETVSRAFSALQREKIIQFRDQTQRRLVIRDKQRLQLLASGASEFDYWTNLKNRKAANTRTAARTGNAVLDRPPTF